MTGENMTVPRFASARDLASARDRFARAAEVITRRVIVCGGTGCLARGAEKVHQALAEVIAERGLAVDLHLIDDNPDEARPRAGDAAVGLTKSGCQGFCQQGPLVTVEPKGYLYVGVRPEDASEIIDALTVGSGPVVRLLYEGRADQCRAGDLEFFAPQRKWVLSGCGRLDPEDLREYIARGGYQALAKVLTSMSPDEVIDEIEAAGLRGRGGAGFPTGKKWRLTREAPGDGKYVIINGDEGDPGAFMDGYLMEGDPHRVLEGMIIAAYAIGAAEGYAYVRAEYPRAVRRLRLAMARAESCGLLGENILGTTFSFRASLKEGAGAFVCGEETALIASIEGRRGMPRPRPPFPAESGLLGRPTSINNVETLANVPVVIELGARAYRECGTGSSPGTKTFALAGQVNRTGLVEVPMGTTLREIIFTAGGGVRGGKAFKAVQIGGPSGGCLTSEHLDLPLDYESLGRAGAMIGSGGLVVMDETSCMVDVARFFMSFVQSESCGKCVPCREGTRRMLELLTKITSGRGTEEDLALLEDVALVVREASLCGLGKTAPNPVLSTLRYFRDEYVAHVREKRCPAGACVELMSYEIRSGECTGCGLCAKACPAGAIVRRSGEATGEEAGEKVAKSGRPRLPFEIIESLCLRCDACRQACPREAVVRVGRRRFPAEAPPAADAIQRSASD